MVEFGDNDDWEDVWRNPLVRLVALVMFVVIALTIVVAMNETLGGELALWKKVVLVLGIPCFSYRVLAFVSAVAFRGRSKFSKTSG